MRKAFPPVLLLAVALNSFAQSETRWLELKDSRMNGRDVEHLQKQLIYSGYDLGSDGADGWFGPQTSNALKKFQQDSKLPVTGTWNSGEKLCEMSPSLAIEKTSKPNESEKQNLKRITVEDLSKLNTPKPYTTYFSSFTLSYTNENRPYYVGVFEIPNALDFKKIDIENEILISPNGRYMAIDRYDNYANTGSSGFMVIDLLVEKTISVDYNQLDTGLNLGLRDRVYNYELTWTKNNTLALNLVYDYEDSPAHPGHESAWKEKLGSLAGKSDPIDVGWFLVKMDRRIQVHQNRINGF